jgi:hypothetical protein
MYFLSNLPHYEFILEDGFVKMPPNGKYKNSSRLRGTFISSCKKVEAGYNH